MARIRCLNCQQMLGLDETLTEKYPEWRALTCRQDSDQSLERTAPSNQTGILAVDKMGYLTTQVGNLYDIISDSTSPLDKPMCQDCADKLLDGMDNELKALEEELGEYRKILGHLRSQRADSTSFDLTASKIELGKLRTEENVLKAELSRLEIEEKQLEEQLEVEKRKGQNGVREEKRLWRQFRDASRQLLQVEAEERGAAVKLEQSGYRLHALARTSVFNMAFHIWHCHRFGTINGFRLGRLPDVQVEWNEINAAWGQTTLLLQCLAKRVDFRFVDYDLVPMASSSFVRCVTGEEKDKELPLYCSGGYKLLGHSKFDQGMVAFLDCLHQLQTEIQKKGGFSLPHAMQRDKIEDQGKEYSVKMQFNSEERWTKAMKCTLTNLKWALAWVASLQS